MRTAHSPSKTRTDPKTARQTIPSVMIQQRYDMVMMKWKRETDKLQPISYAHTTIYNIHIYHSQTCINTWSHIHTNILYIHTYIHTVYTQIHTYWVRRKVWRTTNKQSQYAKITSVDYKPTCRPPRMLGSTVTESSISLGREIMDKYSHNRVCILNCNGETI